MESLSPQMKRNLATARSPLRDHVRSSSPEIESLLDSLLADVRVVKDWDTAITESIQNPLTTLVTLDGDFLTVSTACRATIHGRHKKL